MGSTKQIENIDNLQIVQFQPVQQKSGGALYSGFCLVGCLLTRLYAMVKHVQVSRFSCEDG